MANTYTQIYIHVVFAVQGRQNLIRKVNKEELHKYITGIIQNKGQKLIAINSMPDHVHIFIGMKPNIALSDLIRDVKNNSSTFINEKRWIRGKFNWQKGFGAFSYAHSQIDAVAKYILNQEKHHAKKTFKEEYVEMLKNFNVGYDEKYLFEFYEPSEK
jgi:REP element-mobilizing transposase RayT